MRGYKRYRVSSQRFSEKPMNVEFVIVLDTHRESDVSVDQLRNTVQSKEDSVLNGHPEYVIEKQAQLMLFEGAREPYGAQTPTP
jgi:adenine-specific DNA-methyltransferase